MKKIKSTPSCLFLPPSVASTPTYLQAKCLSSSHSRKEQTDHQQLPPVNLHFALDNAIPPGNKGKETQEKKENIENRKKTRKNEKIKQKMKQNAEYTLGFVKSFVSTRLIPARTSVCAVAVRCAVNSCATASSCAACKRCQFTQLLNLFCCCHDSSTALPVTIVSPVARSSETVTPSTASQNECSATMHDTREKRQRQTPTQTGANDKMTFEPWSAFMIRMHQ